MTVDEAVEILDETCGCTDPLCPDIRYRSMREEARSVLDQEYEDELVSDYIHAEEQRALDYEPPGYWEP